MLNLPNILTLSRIGAIPIIVALFYIEGHTARWIACGLFAAAAITDFFDGYIARRWNKVSALGRFLDPIADKLIVSALLLLLTAFDAIRDYHVLPAMVILLREIVVSGLREFLAELRIGMPVSRLAKWKTAFQMVSLPLLIIADAAPPGFFVEEAGLVFLWAAAALTIITGWDYLRAGLHHMQEPEA